VEDHKERKAAGNRGMGRKKGQLNKTTATLKEAILAAATKHGTDGEGEGGLEGYLFKVASEDVKAFSALLGRVLPLQMVGDDGGPIQVMIQRFSGDACKD